MARWGSRRRELPVVPASSRHDYRDAAIIHGALGAVIVVVGWLVGSDVPKAVFTAVAYFVAATAWSWWRFRRRARRLPRTEEKR